jgi:hypothetical protein
VGGPLTGKLLILLSFAAAFAGAARLLADRGGVLVQAGAGALYAFSPYLLTRVGVGHLTLVVATALLPFALSTLLRPADDLGRTFLWSAAFGFIGFAGALLAGPTLLVGQLADRGRRGWWVVLAFVVGQLPWIVPGLVVSRSDVHLAGAAEFATDARGLVGYIRVAAGFGFWDPGQQISLRLGPTAAAIGFVLLALALAGTADLPAAWGRRVAALAALGMLVALGSRAPLLSSAYDRLVTTPPGELIRESQRLLPLYLVWLAPSAALGARRLARHVSEMAKPAVVCVPLALALVLAGPGLFGLNGRLEPASFPGDWARAKRSVGRAPGSLLAVPFSQYVDLPFAGYRRVLNPIPAYFGGDVIFSSDPGFGIRAQERADPREPVARRIVTKMLKGEEPSRRLVALGVRWVVLLHEENWTDFDILRKDPGLERITGGSSLELFRVRRWKGPAVSRDGRAIGVDTPVLPIADVASDTAVTWYRAGGQGWLRGLDPIGVTAEGVLAVPAGGGLVWYWPTIVVLLGDLVTATAVIVVALRRRRLRA